MSATRQTNWSILALVRFCLAFIVVNGHLNTFFSPNSFSGIVSQFGGKAAVVGFLIVSGFSISASLGRKQEQFLIRRFVRIYPAYLVTIVFAVIVQKLTGPFNGQGRILEPSSWVVIFGNLLLLQMFVVKAVAFAGPVWSLSLEFSYYVAAKFAKFSPKWALPFTGIISLISFVSPVHITNNFGLNLLLKIPALHYIWPFLVGMMLFHFPKFQCFVLAGIVSSVAVYLSPTTPDRLSFITVLLIIAIVYVAARGWGRENIVSDWLGDISYPLYLIHMPLFIFLIALTNLRNPALLIMASFLTAALICLTVEGPFRRHLLRLGSFRILHEQKFEKISIHIPHSNTKP